MKNKVKLWSQDGLIAAGVFVRFPQQFASTHLYTWVERGTVRVKCLAPARAGTRTARSGVEHTNHEATLPPTIHRSEVKYSQLSPTLRSIIVLVYTTQAE